MGVDRVRYKLLAFAIGAAFAGATGTFYVAKLQTATPEMFMFPVSVMILVMVVFGGIGSVWGVVVGALLLQILQSWFLEDLSGWLHALGRLVGVDWLQHVELASSIELIFGLILVLMMLYRREGLIPAARRTADAEPRRADGATRAQRQPPPDPHSHLIGRAPGWGPLLEIADLTVRFGGLVALQSVELSVPVHSVVAVIGPNGSGKSTLVQRDYRAGPDRSGHHPLRRRGDWPAAAASGARARHRPHLSEHPPVPEPQRSRERHDRYACAARYGSGRCCAAAAGDPQRGSCRARACARDSRALRQPAVAARRPSRGEPLLRQPAAHRDRPCARRAAQAADARRADGRDEPGRDIGARRPDQEPQPAGSDDPVDRAQARRRGDAGRQGRRARSRREDRRRDARCGAPRRRGDPRLSRPKCGLCLRPGTSRSGEGNPFPSPPGSSRGSAWMPGTGPGHDECLSALWELLEFRPMLEFMGVDTHYGDLHVLKSVDYRIGRARSSACWAATHRASRRR